MVDFKKLLETETEENAALQRYADYLNASKQVNRLPVQGVHEYNPGYTANEIERIENERNPIIFMPSVRQGIENVKAIANEGFETPENISAKVFGPMAGGSSEVLERTQTWPEKMVRSGTTLPTDVMAGKVLSGPGLRAGDYSDIPGAPQPLSDLIERTQDLAGLAAGGSVAATGLKAEAPGVLSRGAKSLKDRLHQMLAEDDQVGTGITANKYITNKPIENAANLNTSQAEVKSMLPDPVSFPERLYTNYAKAIKPEDVLKSEPVWSGADRLSRDTGIPYNEAFSQIANEFWRRQGANRFITPELAEKYIKRERSGFKLAEDSEAGTGISSLAQRMNETMPEILARQRASEGYEAAIRDPETKKLYTGMWHEEVLDKIAKDKGIPKDQLPTNLIKGYMNDRGRFLTEEAVEKLSQNKSKSKTAMFRSDDEAGTAVGALANNDWFHGTTSKEFNKFDINKGNINNYFGQYPHFTSSIKDVNTNYATKYGIDRYERIEKEMDNLVDTQKYKNATSEEKGKLTTEVLNKFATDNEGAIINSKLNFKNPANLIDDNTFSILDHVGTIENSLLKNGKKYGFDGKKLSEKVFDELEDGDGSGNVKLKDLNSSIRKNFPEDKEALGHIIANVYKDMGYDGILMNANEIFPHMSGEMDTKTFHAIPLKENTVKSKYSNNMMFSDDIVGTGIAAVQPRFYSHMENVINDAKMMVRDKEGKRVEVPQEKFNANELNAYLKNKGVSNEEIEALRIPDLLEGKKSVTKQELLNHLNENKVELNETWKKNVSKEEYEQMRKADPSINSIGNPRFAQYQLPGATNYRELLLSTKDNPKNIKRITELNSEIFNNEKEMVIARKNKDENKIKEISNKQGNLITEKRDLEHSFTTDHWPGQKDVVVHSRMNDRFIPDESGPSIAGSNKTSELYKDLTGNNPKDVKGYNTLHAEEIQSDLHQKGNSEGYRLSLKDKNKLEPEFNRIEEKIVNSGNESVMSNPEIKDAIKSAVDKKIITEAEAKTYLRYADSERYNAVKDAPFKSTWSDLMIKRLIRQASEEGKDAISWTPGQAQADRYQLSNHLGMIEYNPQTKQLSGWKPGAKYSDNRVIQKSDIEQSDLHTYVGKEAADKLLNNPTSKSALGNRLEGLDLKVGGEFHKKFYDEIMVNKVNAIAKKYGSRVEEKEIDSNKPSEHKWFGIRQGADGLYEVVSDGQVLRTEPTRQAADAWINEQQELPTKQKIWFLKLTPELKKAALEKGFSMFETGLPLTPVQGNPFENKNKFKLIPISGDPFK